MSSRLVGIVEMKDLGSQMADAAIYQMEREAERLQKAREEGDRKWWIGLATGIIVGVLGTLLVLRLTGMI